MPSRGTYKRKEIPTLKCVVCGVMFERIHTRAITCSPRCSKLRAAQKDAERYSKECAAKGALPPNSDKEPYVLKERRPPDIVCEFRQLRPGDPGFEELAKQITPIDRIRTTPPVMHMPLTKGLWGR